MQLCRKPYSLKSTRVCALNRHTSKLYLSTCDQCLHLSRCFRTTDLKTGTVAERRQRRGKRFRRPLNMRVNHNWFALVTVELADRCRRGAPSRGGWGGGGGGGLPTGRGNGLEEEGGRRMCLFMHSSGNSQEALLFPDSPDPPCVW